MKTIASTTNIITILRISLGVLMFYSGVSKVIDDFSAASYLENAVSGPFSSIYIQMAGSPIVDYLVIYGEIGIGVALILGILSRFASACGMLMMAMFYFSIFPPDMGIVNNQFIYFICFALLYVSGAGKHLGIDYFLIRTEFVKNKYRWFKYLLA